jgi:nitrite reductase (NADH) small subunit
MRSLAVLFIIHHLSFIISSMGWTSLCELGELADRQGKYVEIGGFQLAVFLVDGRVFAMDNTCPHAGGSLWEGDLDGQCVICPWHAWTFNLETGQLRGLPGVKVTTYKTRLLPREGQPTLVQAELPIY